MTEAQMRELVSAAFIAGWPTASGSVPFALENEGAAIPPSGSDFFAYLTVTPTSSQQRTTGKVGNRKVRRDAWIQVKLWGPADRGAAGIAGLCDAARKVLEMVSLPSPIAGDDPVTTQAAMAGPGQGTIDGRWYLGLVRIPAWFRETK